MLANIIRNRKKTAIGGGGGGIVIDNGDPYYSAVSMLLPMDGTNGSTTFTDSGPNALTITPTGTTISTSQAKYGASGYFNGTSAYLTAASSAVTLGTSDFTIEFWIYPLDVRTFSLYDSRTNETNPNGNGFVIGTSATQTWVVYQAGNKIVGPTVVANQWTHVAVTRSGSSIKMWINGVQVGSTWTTTGSFSDGATLIGTDYPKNARFVYGYVDDFRISQFARYTSTFTPPTAALPTTASSTPADPYYGYTSLLLHMDGTNASTNFVDSGPSALTVTRTGTPAISTAQSKYGVSSVALSGTTDRLDVASNAVFAFGTGDFTVEFWAYFNTVSSAQTAFVNVAVSGGFSFYWAGSAGYFGVLNSLVVSNRQANKLVSAWSPSTSTWYHVAVTRSGTTLRVFINGVQIGSATDSTSYIQGPLQIGGSSDGTGWTVNGNIDDLRIAKYARTIAAAPTQAFPNIYNPYASLPVSGAALWLAGDDSSTLYTDAGTSAVTKSGDLVYQWTDKSGNSRNAIQTTSGNRPTWVAPANARNNLGALGFNASQWIDLASNTAIAFGTGDFTVEAWIKPAGFGGANTAVISCGNNGFLLYITPAGILRVGQYGVADFGTSPAIPTTSWTHVAISRSGTSLKVFFNGVLNQTLTDTFNYSGSQTARIGWDATIGNGFSKYNGQIQNLVVYKGQALYTANFTPWMS